MRVAAKPALSRLLTPSELSNRGLSPMLRIGGPGVNSGRVSFTRPQDASSQSERASSSIAMNRIARQSSLLVSAAAGTTAEPALRRGPQRSVPVAESLTLPSPSPLPAPYGAERGRPSNTPGRPDKSVIGRAKDRPSRPRDPRFPALPWESLHGFMGTTGRHRIEVGAHRFPEVSSVKNRDSGGTTADGSRSFSGIRALRVEARPPAAVLRGRRTCVAA